MGRQGCGEPRGHRDGAVALALGRVLFTLAAARSLDADRGVLAEAEIRAVERSDFTLA